MNKNRPVAKTLIRIGHPAYAQNSENGCYYAYSKAEAVRELQWRGYKRDVAREAVNRILETPNAFTILSHSETGYVTEMHNQLQVMQEYNQRLLYSTRSERMRINGGRLA